MELTGSDMLRGATADCQVVLVCATDGEAEPVRTALSAPERYVVATKTLYVGGLPGSGRVVLAISGCDKANAAHVLTCLLQAMMPAPRLVVQFGIAGAFPSAGPGPAARVGDIVLATDENYSDTGSSSPEKWLSAAELGLPIATVNGLELGGSFPLDITLVLAATDVIQDIDWSGTVTPEVTAMPVASAATRGATAAPAGSMWSTGVGRPGGLPAVLLGTCLTASRVTGLRGQAETAAARWGALAESMEGAAAAHICALHRAPFLEIRGVSNAVVDRDRDSWQVERAVAVAGRAALAVAEAVDRLPLNRTV